MNSRVNKMQKRTAALCKGIPENILSHTLKVNFGVNTRDTSPKPTTLTIENLLSRLAKPDTNRGQLTLSAYLALDKKDSIQKKQQQSEKDGEYIILGAFARSNTRAAKDMEAMSGFMIDIDGGNFSRSDIEKIMEGTFCIAFTTYSHHPGDPRWRIAIPYAESISPDDHHKVYAFFNAAFKGALDPRCDTTAQIWFTPACPFDAVGVYQVFAVKGTLLEVKALPEVPVKAAAHLPARPNVMSIELERVRSALGAIPSDDRTTWVNFGIALKQNLPQEAAYELWLQWSMKSDKFDPDDAEATWGSLKDAPDADAITLGSVFYEAKKQGWVDKFEPMHEEAERLNQSHFVAFSGGKNYVFAETYNHEMQREVLQPYPLKDFREHHVNRRVRVQVGDKFRELPVVDLWYEHPARRTFNQIVFMPGKEAPVGTYNTWRGFAVVPSPGNWDLFKSHIRDNVCSGDQASFDYLIGWMAFAVQHPDKPPGVAVVLQGGRGTGKGKFASTFMKLFGTHGLQITQASHLVGKFNQHLRDCVLLFVDEAIWAGDKAGENVLKGLITEPHLQVEKKFQDVTSAPNRLHIIMASNNDWVVPAGEHERRYFVLKVADTQMQNTAYFEAIDNQMLRQGGLAAMMYDLLAIDLSQFNIRNVPKNAALDEQKIQSLSASDLWWMDQLGSGNSTNWKQQSRAQIAQSFAEHGGTLQGRRSETRVGQYLKKAVPGLKKVTVALHPNSTPIPCYEFPDLPTCKAAFIARHGFVGNPWA